MKPHRFSLIALLAAVLCADPLSAQGGSQDTAALRRMVEQRAGRSVSQAEILQQLQQSGMTRAQVRARLQQAGFDPSLADRYFDLIERGAGAGGAVSDEFIDALSRIGIGTAGMQRRQRSDTLSGGLRFEPLDTLAGDTLDAEMRGPEVFGLQLFRRAQSQFQPLLSGPVDAGYRVGPGDELIIVLTGDVELAYTLEVTREGQIFIPDVGQVSVNGLTLAQLEDRLYDRVGRVYSSVRRGPGATSRLQLSMGQLRTNQVYVYGDVSRPGAIQLSSLGSVFHALYMAGGPTADGSFRHIEVERGGRVIQVADLYDFLVYGRSAGDIRLEQNDRIFVPPAGLQVQAEGSVRRPAIYELRPGEGLAELVRFAGGLRSDALVRRVQIDRILPPAQRRPGYYRGLVDIDLTALSPAADPVPLVDGDVVHVFAVNDERRYRLWLDGEVRNPGLYEWAPGMTLGQLLERADGTTERAYLSRVHVYREIERDGRRGLLQAALDRDGADGLGLALADNDSLVVLSRRDLRNEEFVAIDGFVKDPDRYLLAEGMTLQDLILAAGGFTHGAYPYEAEISRLPDPITRSDTIAIVMRLPLMTLAGDNGDGSNGELPNWVPDASELRLQHGDRVFVRRAPGFETEREVAVTGQVMMPGKYVLRSRGERLIDLLYRTGGTTDEAYLPGMHVIRDGTVVAADLQRALRNPRDRNNIVLQAGDSVHVPTYDPTVLVTGEVNFEARALHLPGRSLDYYLNQAGGLSDRADRGRITVIYQNGERSVAERHAFGWRKPRVDPGSIIFVAARPDAAAGINWDMVFTRTAAMLGTLATVVLAIGQLR